MGWTPSALALVRGPAGCVWIERGRPPSVGRWALPGGRIEAGEGPVEAARRELAEETGLVAADGVHLAVLEEAFEDADGAHLYDVTVHVALRRRGQRAPLRAGRHRRRRPRRPAARRRPDRRADRGLRRARARAV
ncbi:MAG: NUDIX domain-containing protein, partial [Actinomycetota bacterium]